MRGRLWARGGRPFCWRNWGGPGARTQLSLVSRPVILSVSGQLSEGQLLGGARLPLLVVGGEQALGLDVDPLEGTARAAAGLHLLRRQDGRDGLADGLTGDVDQRLVCQNVVPFNVGLSGLERAGGGERGQVDDGLVLFDLLSVVVRGLDLLPDLGRFDEERVGVCELLRLEEAGLTLGNNVADSLESHCVLCSFSCWGCCGLEYCGPDGLRGPC